MKCPVCTTVNLLMSERQGVEIDYCPECRGVWLDRGELDKIIERAVPHELSPPPQPAYAPQPPYAPRPQHAPHHNNYGNSHASGYGHGDSHGHKPHRKKSFLEELFD